MTPERWDDRPHIMADGDYFCPAHGTYYTETRADEDVNRCLACGAPVAPLAPVAPEKEGDSE